MNQGTNKVRQDTINTLNALEHEIVKDSAIARKFLEMKKQVMYEIQMWENMYKQGGPQPW